MPPLEPHPSAFFMQGEQAPQWSLCWPINVLILGLSTSGPLLPPPSGVAQQSGVHQSNTLSVPLLQMPHTAVVLLKSTNLVETEGGIAAPRFEGAVSGPALPEVLAWAQSCLLP